MERDGFLVGLNWSGAAAAGFDLEPAAVQRNLNGHNLHSHPEQRYNRYLVTAVRAALIGRYNRPPTQ